MLIVDCIQGSAEIKAMCRNEKLRGSRFTMDYTTILEMGEPDFPTSQQWRKYDLANLFNISKMTAALLTGAHVYII